MVKNIIHISFSYLKYYKKQTAALLAGIILSSALLTGMGSLFESGKHAALEHARTEYGDWHYSTRGDADWIQKYQTDSAGNGYKIEKTGMETVRKVIEEPFAMELVYADSGYLDMMGRDVIKGHYPQKEDEIAMDIQTLQNLGKTDDLGSQIILDGETFTLCGIMEDMPEKLPELLGNFSQVFVNSTLDYGKNGTFLYLKFKENHKVFRQLESFCKKFGISGSDMKRNNRIAGYVGGNLQTGYRRILSKRWRPYQVFRSCIRFVIFWGKFHSMMELLNGRNILQRLQMMKTFRRIRKLWKNIMELQYRSGKTAIS